MPRRRSSKSGYKKVSYANNVFVDTSSVEKIITSRLYGGGFSSLPIEFIKMREDSPDPCRYAPNDLVFGKGSRNVILGRKFLSKEHYGPRDLEELREERLKFRIIDNPGPGTYDANLNKHVVTPKIIEE